MYQKFQCLVCGWNGLKCEPKYPFGSHEICACCGTQYGLDVTIIDDVEKVRNEWLSEGAPWFDDDTDLNPPKPKPWNIETAILQCETTKLLAR